MTPQGLQRALAKLPTKWSLTIVGFLLCYALCQPVLNRGLGWKLPSIAQVLGFAADENRHQGQSAGPDVGNAHKSDAQAYPDATASAEVTRTDNATEPHEEPTSTGKDSQRPSDALVKAEPNEKANADAPASQSTRPVSGGSRPSSNGPVQRNSPVGESTKSSESLLYGILKETGQANYVSIKGLRYGPGSEEGHRLKHLERHLKDIPTRPGKHGVFDGDMAQVLRWIDDAYDRGLRGAKGVRKKQEEDRTVLEVTFDKPIGFVGGRDGARTNHPSSKRLRLVVEGNRFITAFPF